MREMSATSPCPAPVTPRPTANRPWRVLISTFALLLTGNIWLAIQNRAQQSATDAEHHFWIISHGEYSAQARFHAFLKLVAIQNTEWRSANLLGLNFEGLWLADADLHAADFTGDNFSRATLARAQLAKSTLQKTDFTEADCTHANFDGVDLYRSILLGTRFNQSGLRGAGLQEAQARDANFAQADLSHAFLLMANCSNANFVGANLTGASLEAAILKNANLHLTRLAECNLKDTDFTGANWWRAQGLSPEQVIMLEAKFSPDGESDLREDYLNWRVATGRGPVAPSSSAR